eukprot:scaffold126469_cov90-Phaeocystis_antarctica.AAC.1
MACVSNVKQRLRAPREHALTRNQPLVDGPIGDAWQRVPPPPPAGSLGRQTCKVWLRPPGAGATVHGNDIEQSVPRLRSNDRRRCMTASKLRSTRLFSNGTSLVASPAYPRCDMYCTARCCSVAHTVGLASLRASALLGKCASLTWAVFFSSILALYAANRVDQPPPHARRAVAPCWEGNSAMSIAMRAQKKKISLMSPHDVVSRALLSAHH